MATAGVIPQQEADRSSEEIWGTLAQEWERDHSQREQRFNSEWIHLARGLLKEFLDVDIREDDKVVEEVRILQGGEKYTTIGDDDTQDANVKQAYDKLRVLETNYSKSESHLLLSASLKSVEIKHFKGHMQTYRSLFPFYPGSQEQVVEREITLTSQFQLEIVQFFNTLAEVKHNQIHECRIVVLCHGTVSSDDYNGDVRNTCHLIIENSIPGKERDQIPLDDVNQMIYFGFEEARKINDKLNHVTVLHCCCHGYLHDKSINNIWFKVDTLSTAGYKKPTYRKGTFLKLEDYVSKVTKERTESKMETE